LDIIRLIFRFLKAKNNFTHVYKGLKNRDSKRDKETKKEDVPILTHPLPYVIYLP